LIHISELAWHRVNHPKEVVSSRDKVQVYVLRLDRENRRIELSLKRLQPNPWADVEKKYHVGQLVVGTVSRLADFGAFVTLEGSLEGLLHTNQLLDPLPSHAAEVLHSGQSLLLRVISVEPENQRIGLSLRDVSQREWADWQAEQQVATVQAEENSLESANTPLS
jgi:ribosomal protein S1